MGAKVNTKLQPRGIEKKKKKTKIILDVSFFFVCVWGGGGGGGGRGGDSYCVTHGHSRTHARLPFVTVLFGVLMTLYIFPHTFQLISTLQKVGIGASVACPFSSLPLSLNQPCCFSNPSYPAACLSNPRSHSNQWESWLITSGC